MFGVLTAALALILSAAGAAGLPASARGPAPGTVVLELFTSQGCSSCPPADRLLGEAAGKRGVIAISRPVTYWDRLGWKDTLARAENTNLQHIYRARFGARSVYTPQMVADGRRQWVGSNRGRLAAELKHMRDSARVRAAIGQAGALHVRIDGATLAPADVNLVALQSRADVAVRRGENRGRALQYVNVALAERQIGSWTGGAKRLKLDASTLASLPGDRLAILVQMPGAGPILGAAMVRR